MVTILMAVYNGERYLKGQLDSLKNQTYGKWRLIVRDDGSSD
ncbi:MAG TPA: glycosyltransferase family 2 protein, partial [Lachnospiraceae bacterium]|nr:glycosyltransferase family 2 protein [Lachnospiraceae bacterium]